jgi:acyl carrier protein
VSVDDLRAVEEAVAGHPDVLEVAAVDLDGAVAVGVVPVAFASAPAIRDHAWRLLGDGRAPRTVALLAALPRDGAGAVDRAELRRVLREDDPPASAYAPPRTELEIEVAEVLREVLDLARVGLDDDFVELGGDSLQAVEVANLLAERLGLAVTLEEVFDAATVRNLTRGAAG